MTMFEYVPMFAVVGVPLRRPVEVLKLAHDGRLEIAKRSVSPFGSLALGWKLYAWLTVTALAGTPEIVGGDSAAAARCAA